MDPLFFDPFLGGCGKEEPEFCKDMPVTFFKQQFDSQPCPWFGLQSNVWSVAEKKLLAWFFVGFTGLPTHFKQLLVSLVVQGFWLCVRPWGGEGQMPSGGAWGGNKVTLDVQSGGWLHHFYGALLKNRSTESEPRRCFGADLILRMSKSTVAVLPLLHLQCRRLLARFLLGPCLSKHKTKRILRRQSGGASPNMKRRILFQAPISGRPFPF